MKREILTLAPVVLFLTVALVGVMVISAYYADSHGMVSLRPVEDSPSGTSPE